MGLISRVSSRTYRYINTSDNRLGQLVLTRNKIIMVTTEVISAEPVAKISKIEEPKNGSSQDPTTLKFAKLSELAVMPTRGSVDSAGYDLYAAYDAVIQVGHRKLIKTDIQVAVPSGCYARIAPRSGLAFKHGIDVGAGVVDADYRGNVQVLLFNLDFMNNKEFEVKKGDRIAQLVIEKIAMLDIEECSTLTETDRGAGGFGSTGK